MINYDTMPIHVAITMDGNGRWAKKRLFPRLMGHNAGVKTLKEIVKKADALRIKYLTVYAFSTENWKRSEEEVNGIFKLLLKYMKSELGELKANQVKINILGNKEGLPKDVLKTIEKAEKDTKHNTGLVLNIALNYGSRDEIKYAMKSIAMDIKEGILDPEGITEELISKRLYTGEKHIPDPELLIRTSGEQRISNYLLWQIAYSELAFTDTLWPDFTGEEFEYIIKAFQKRDRRFGGRNE